MTEDKRISNNAAEWSVKSIGMPITGGNIAIATQITQTLSEDEIAEELLSQRYAHSPIDESLLSDIERQFKVDPNV